MCLKNCYICDSLLVIPQAIKIIRAESALSAKKLGRGVKNFNEEVWERERLRIMTEVLMEKFKIPALRQFLLATEESTIVECSPTDKIWGIGIKLGNLECFQREKWQGLNLLGEALMAVRATIRDYHN